MDFREFASCVTRRCGGLPVRRHSRAIDVLRRCTVEGSDRITEEDTAVIIVAGWERVIALLRIL